MRDRVGFVVLDADIGFPDAHGLHQNRDADDQFLAVLQHRAVVRRKIGFALHAVDDDALGLLSGRNREFHVRGERRSAHADDAGVLDLGDDLLRREGADLHQRLRTVDALGPVVALALDGDHHLAQALAVDDHIDSRHRTRNRGVDVRRHETAGFGDELAREHPIAFGDLGHRRGADVLCEGNRHHIGQRQHLDRFGAAQLIFRRMDSAHWKCSHRYSKVLFLCFCFEKPVSFFLIRRS